MEKAKSSAVLFWGMVLISPLGVKTNISEAKRFSLMVSRTVTALEWGILAVGCVTAFIVSLAAIKFLMDFVKKHSFASFGWYRIVLGALVIGYFLIFGR